MAKPAQNKRRDNRKREPKEFKEEVIQVDRVTRVTKGGRQLRFRATVVIGDEKGRVSYGIGKASEVQAAIQKAVTKAKKQMITIPVYEGTIPHTIQVKYKAAKVFLKPAGEGTGIIAGGAVRKMLDLAGIKNVLSKSLGSDNRLNTTKATFKALSELRERPGMESDYAKLKKAMKREETGEDEKTAPQVKKISKKEAKERVEASSRGTKKAATKTETKAKKTTPKKEASK